MAGFKKGKAEQAALKLGIYGAPGSGKTFTSLLIAEGLSKHYGKRIALVDTERGSDFYVQRVPERSLHPDAFDIDVLYSRSITEILEAVKGLGPEYGVVIIDSITHVWEACRNAYAGPTTSADTIPFTAWGKIKKPYKELINWLLSSTLHVIFCGRQGNEFDEGEDGQLRRVGYKMKAEGETPYEPHILLRMEAVKDPKTNMATVTAIVEKDRTGILAGRTIANPTYDSIAKPMLGLFGDTQATVQDSEEVGARDAEKLAEIEQAKIHGSSTLLRELMAKLELCKTVEDVKALGKTITPDLKKRMTTSDTTTLKEAYMKRESELR